MEDYSPINSYIVTLIHGTWGRSSPWIATSSKFREQLKEHLGGNVMFYEIPWTGANSHIARKEAVKGLEEHIACVAKEHEHSLHFLIGHSHGGNIALYALGAKESQPEIAGVICMNTPFVCVLRRNTLQFFNLSGAVGVTLMFAISILYSFGSLSARGEAAGWFEAIESFSLWKKALFGLAGVVAINILSHFLSHIMLRTQKVLVRVAKWTQSRREELIRDIGLPRTAVPVLSIRSVGDEVVGAVAFSTTVANLPFMVLHPWSLATLFGVLFTAHWASSLPQLVSMFVSREAQDLYTSIPSYAIPRKILEYALSSGVYLIGTVGVVLLLSFSIAPMLRLAPLGLGWRNLVNSLFVKLSFTLVPVNSTHTEFLELDPENRRPLTLSHSKIYDQPDAIKKIAEWIKVRQIELLS